MNACYLIYRMVIVLLLDLVYIVYIGVYLYKCSFVDMPVHVHDPQVSGAFYHLFIELN